MLTDSIKMRKIRYDVLQYIEDIEFIDSIEQYLNSDEKSISRGQELLSKTNSEFSADIDEICKSLNSYIDSYADIESINHSPLLDYLYAVEQEYNADKIDDEQEKQEDYLYNFIFQLVQIQKLQSKIVDTIYDTMYRGEDNNIYSVIDNKLMFSYSDIVGKKDSVTDDEFSILAMQYIQEMIVKTKRKVVLDFEFDEEGFYLSLNGDEYFEDYERKEIIEETQKRVNLIFGEEDSASNEEFEDGIIPESSEEIKNNETDLIDDVTVSGDKTSLSDEAKERIEKLKHSLKESANKTNKF